LTFEDYIELNKLGIIINDCQNDNEILEKIKTKGNLRKVKETEIEDMFHKYNLFYINNNRRPTEDDDIELVEKYREYLSNVKKADALKYLKKVDYPLNVEESLIMKEFPSEQSINDYIEYIENMYLEGITLDKLEKRTIESISKLKSLKDKPIINLNLDNKVQKIDILIKVLKKYLLDYPDEKFNNPEKFVETPEIKKAINDLQEYAKHVTNLQFETLLEMGIALPEEINMSLEQRKEELGEYESFFDKEENIKKSIVKTIKEFIKTQNRRPNIDNEEEYDLAIKYNQFFKERNSVWTQMIAKTIIEKNMSLTIDEKIVCGYNINPEDLELIYKLVISDFNNCSIEKYNFSLMKKKLNILKKNGYIDDRFYKILKRTNNLIDYVFKNMEKNNIEGVKSYLYNNQALIPFGLIKYMYIKLDMSLKKVNIAYKKNDKFINIAHQQYLKEMEKINDYINYIKENGTRPAERSILNSHLRDYLAKASSEDIKLYSDRLNELNIPLSLEELYLLKRSSSYEEKELYKKIQEKRKAFLNLDDLDQRMYSSLDVKFSFGNDTDEVYKDELISVLNKDTKNDIINELQQKIEDDPSQEIDFSGIYISDTTKEQLEKYRMIRLSKSFIGNLIENMKKEKKSYKELLDKKNLELLETMIKYCKTSNENLDLIDELIKLNRKIIIENNNINIELFIIDY